MKNIILSKKGFTIVEMVVVISVFLFVIGAAVAIFLSVINHQRRILAEQQLLNQISYVEEYMSKALRMAKPEVAENCLVDSEGNNYSGYIYLLTRYNSEKNYYEGIKFINQSDNDACQEFFFNGNYIKEVKNGGDSIPLTSTNIKINYVKFSINGSDGSPSSTGCSDIEPCGAFQCNNDVCIQPRLTITIGVQAIGGETSERVFQTTISQRNLNVQ